MTNQTVKEQFNKQAENFANWAVAKNTEYLDGYFEFCGIQASDKVLDVACGPGEFTVYIAKRIAEARGVDISNKEIAIANNLAIKFGLGNIGFDCNDVENLPYKDNSFSVVLCKSAFHHFPNAKRIFKEMIRCCGNNGVISIQDIRAYDDEYVNDYFEKFDKLVDISHHKTLSSAEFKELYHSNKITVTGDMFVDVELNVNEYIGHAVQTKETTIQLQEHLNSGRTDNRLKNYLFEREGELYYKRMAYLIKGTK